MRIALLTHSPNPRGGVVHAVQLGEALQQAGHRVTVMAPALAGQRWFRTVACETALVPVAPELTEPTALSAALRRDPGLAADLTTAMKQHLVIRDAGLAFGS